MKKKQKNIDKQNNYEAGGKRNVLRSERNRKGGRK